ncbi:MAG: hypothetical protein RL685_7604 [Pseudomonadota bacterium]
MVDEKRRPQQTQEQPEPDSATSGEFARNADGEREPYRAKSTKRRALRPSADDGHGASPTREPPLPGASPNEEQTLRAAKAPQRIRMSLRMRRVAAGSASDPANELGPRDPVVLRLGGQSFELSAGGALLAGRATESQIPLGDRLCSRKHALFVRTEEGAASVRDLGSMNGTYVNGVRLQAQHQLSRGDWITLGNETLELCVASPTTQAQSPTIPAAPLSAGHAARARVESAGAKTDPGSPLLSLASYAARAEGRTPSPLGAADVKKPLDVLLSQAERGDVVAEADARMATLLALHMAKSTADTSWLDYGFRLYAALRLPWSEDLIERLHEAVPQLPAARWTAFRTYLEVLEQAGARWDEQQQRRVAQLRGLLGRLAKNR